MYQILPIRTILNLSTFDGALSFTYTDFTYSLGIGMFDIGFFEICLIGVIALLVIGPEKLPRVARTVGLWLGKAQGMIKTVKYEIDEQVRLEELKQSMEKVNQDFQHAVSSTNEAVDETVSEIKESVQPDSQASDLKQKGDESKT